MLCRLLSLLLLTGLLTQCASPTYQPQPLPAKALAKHLMDRATMIVCASESDMKSILSDKDLHSRTGFSVSSATPVSEDGYLLTAAHAVTSPEGGVLLVLQPFGPDRKLRRARAQLIWKDDQADLALVRVPWQTPNFYSWTPRGRTLPEGTPVTHGGLTTGPKGNVGKLQEAARGTGNLLNPQIQHSLHLRPGDSGGPLITLSGELIGINRAVGYEGVMDTTFFMGSHSTRPDPAKITSLIEKARRNSAR